MRPSMPTGAWIAGGLVAAALIVPTVSYAVATQTEIIGSNGGTPAADVTKAHQLETTEATPVNFYAASTFFHFVAAETSVCVDIAPPVSGKAFVLKDFSVAVDTPSGGLVQLYNVPDCPSPLDIIGSVAAAANSTTTVPFDPGFVFGNPGSSGGHYLSIHAIAPTGGPMDFSATVTGYTVPKSEAPTTEPIRGS